VSGDSREESERTMHKKLSDERINELLEIGIDEFAQNGLDKANINTIAKKAQMSVGVIYKYYGDKNQFSLECVRHSLELLREVLDAAAGASEDVSESIHSVVCALVTHAKKHSNYNVMYNEITSGSAKMYASVLAQEIETMSATVYSKLFERAKSEGKIKNDIDSRLFAFFFDNLLMMLQFSYSCEYYKERMKIFCGEEIMDDDERMIEAFMNFMKAALGV
jgi:TetR/AcrR family transcriptional regulator